MLTFEPKDPAAVINYQLTFGTELARLTPLTITSLTWSVIPMAGDLSPLTIVSHQEPVDNSSSIIRLSGGTIGIMYRVECLITFSDGEVTPVSFRLPIEYT